MCCGGGLGKFVESADVVGGHRSADNGVGGVIGSGGWMGRGVPVGRSADQGRGADGRRRSRSGWRRAAGSAVVAWEEAAGGTGRGPPWPALGAWDGRGRAVSVRQCCWRGRRSCWEGGAGGGGAEGGAGRAVRAQYRLAAALAGTWAVRRSGGGGGVLGMKRSDLHRRYCGSPPTMAPPA